jgi:hypothetical protein
MPTLGAPTVFPIPPDGGTAIKFARTWLTDVLAANDGTEVRLATRDAPIRRMEFSAVFGNAREAGQFRSLWYAATQPLRFLVPLWREASVPSALAGAVVTTDTTNRRFVTGANAAILWQDEQTWEVLQVDAFNATSVTAHVPVTGTYVIGAVLVIPLMAAWLEPPSIDERGYAESVPLVFHEELPKIAGIDSTVVGLVTPAVSTLSIYPVGGGINPYPNREMIFVAKAKDADGVPIVDPSATWALDVSDPNLILVPGVDRQSALVRVLSGAPGGKHVTVTVGTTTASYQVT